jgi:WD40 repeat protein
MRSDDVVLDDGFPFADASPGRTRLGHLTFRVWTKGRIAVLAAIIGLPWLPAFYTPPEDLPMQRARGEAGVSIRRLAFSPDGHTVALTDERGRARLWSVVADRGVERDLDLGGYAGIASFSPNGRYLAIGREEPGIVLHELDRRVSDRLLEIPVREAKDLRFSRDGRTLAISNHRSNEIILWDLEEGIVRMTLRGHKTPVCSLAFANDGGTLTSTGLLDPVVLVWDLATGRPQRVPTEASVICGAISPDGRTLITVNDHLKALRFWNLPSGQLVRQIVGRRSPIRSVALSPGSRWVATGAADQFVSLWNVATGIEVRRLDAGGDVIHNIAFSPDGRTLAATGNDGFICLWDLDRLREGEGLDSL